MTILTSGATLIFVSPLHARSLAFASLLSFAVLSASAQTLEDAFDALKPGVKAAAAQRPAAAPPAAAAAVNLSAQTGYAQGAPDQGPIGNCHEFAATALLNAAYYRQFKKSVRFSPGDLFIRSVLLTDQFANYINGDAMALTEGGDAAADLDAALAHGVSPESDLPYSVFAREYLSRILPANARDMRRADMSGSLTKLANMAELARIRLEQGATDAYDAVLAERERLASEQVAKNRALITRRFRKRWPEIERERARYQADFARGGFTVSRTAFPSEHLAKDLPFSEDVAPGTMLEAWDIRNKDNCRHAGRPQKAFLVDQLDAGRPVAVSFDLYDFSSWRQGKGAGDMHAFVVVGYAPGPDGLVFKTLNSWGAGNNHPIPEAALCRMAGATVLLAASDPR